MGKIGVATLAPSFFNGYLHVFQVHVTRTTINSRKNSILGHIGLFTYSYLPLNDKRFSHRLIMEKILFCFDSCLTSR